MATVSMLAASLLEYCGALSSSQSLDIFWSMLIFVRSNFACVLNYEVLSVVDRCYCISNKDFNPETNIHQ